MIERNANVVAAAKKLLGDKICHAQDEARCQQIEIALAAYQQAPTASHYDSLYSLVAVALPEVA